MLLHDSSFSTDGVIMHKQNILLLIICLFFILLLGCNNSVNHDTDIESIGDKDLAKFKAELIDYMIACTDPLENITKEDIQLDNIYLGHYSDLSCNEAFVFGRISGCPHVAGKESRIGVLLNLDTKRIICGEVFRYDECSIEKLETYDGVSKILIIGKSESTGMSSYTVEIYGIENDRIKREDCFPKSDMKILQEADEVYCFCDLLLVKEGKTDYIWKWDMYSGSMMRIG